MADNTIEDKQASHPRNQEDKVSSYAILQEGLDEKVIAITKPNPPNPQFEALNILGLCS